MICGLNLSSLFHVRMEAKQKKINCEFAADNTAQVLEKWMDLYLVGGSVALNKFSSQSHL